MLATCIYHRREKSWRTAAILMLAVAAASWGQVMQERAGRALDANPLVGSGGSNTPVRGYVPINGNQVMTGNVTGLGYFHGNVPYSSTSEFSGRLGSSSLRNFARQSAGAPDGGTYTGGYSTYYLPSQVISTSQGRISPGTLSGMDARLSGPGAINPTSSARPSSGVPNSLTPVFSPADTRVPIRTYRQTFNNDDVTGSGETSSLFGWKRTPGQALDANMQIGIQPAARAGDEEFVVKPGEKTTDKTSKGDQQDNRDGSDKTDNTPGGIGRVGTEQDGQLKPVMPIQNDAVKPERNLDGSIREPKENPLTPAGRTAAKETKGTKSANAMGTTDSPAVAAVKSELARYQSADPSLPNYRSKQWMDNRLREAQAQSYTLPTVPAAKGDVKGKTEAKRGLALEPDSVENVMNLADTQMKAGRYIQAANTYQNALMLDAGYTPAMIGRAQAEIAAGFYESAAYDLRFLYTRYPDLATFKSDLRRNMGNRLDYVINDLTELNKKSPKGPAAMLLAYCYYQTGQTDKLKEHVALWGQVAPNDRWQKLAAEQWAKESKSK